MEKNELETTVDELEQEGIKDAYKKLGQTHW